MTINVKIDRVSVRVLADKLRLQARYQKIRLEKLNKMVVFVFEKFTKIFEKIDKNENDPLRGCNFCEY